MRYFDYYLIFVALHLALLVVCGFRYRKTSYYDGTRNSYLKVLFDKGLLGEYRLYRSLSKYESDGARFAFNSYFPKASGETAEVDVIMVYKGQLFVFECKNYGGWIFGNAQDQYWTQTYKSGKKNKFYNPIKQNESHIRVIGEAMGRICRMNSVVVFGNRCKLRKLQLKGTDTVVVNKSRIKRVVDDIVRHNKEDAGMTENLYQKLLPYTMVSKDVKKKHIQEIKASKKHLGGGAHSYNGELLRYVVVLVFLGVILGMMSRM